MKKKIFLLLIIIFISENIMAQKSHEHNFVLNKKKYVCKICMIDSVAATTSAAKEKKPSVVKKLIKKLTDEQQKKSLDSLKKDYIINRKGNRFNKGI
jgi:hypothetical protein